MAGLLPSSPDTAAAEDASPRIIGLDSDDADDLIAALSSETARELLAAFHEEPATPSAVADRVDTSLQNAQYHIRNLEEAELIEEIDTCYSEKGREMSVYAPRDRPLVVVASPEEETTDVAAALKRLLGAIGALGVASLVVERLVGGPFGWFEDAAPTAGDAGADEAEPAADERAEDTPPGDDATVEEDAADAEPTPDPETVDAVDPAAELADGAASVETATGLPPGLLFFAGGLAVLLCGFAVWYYYAHRRAQ